MNKAGLQIIISGPSGTGKGTVVKELIKQGQSVLSISATTRSPRKDEIEGTHYFFKTKDEFEQLIKENKLLEYAKFCGNYYGTPKDFVKQTIASGNNVILEIEVEGALQVKAIAPESVFIFIVPPSLGVLEKRLISRGTETMDVIKNRLKRAKEELLYFKEYDYVVVNDHVDRAVDAILNIIDAENKRSHRLTQMIEKIMKE